MSLLDTYRKWRGKKLTPGSRCPASGVYALVVDGQRAYEATCVKGEPMPPTPGRGQHWTLVNMSNVDEGGA